MTDSISALNLETGQVVGGYTLVSRLGGGAMGMVWTVRDDAGQLFAMKILRDSLSEEEADLNPTSEQAREQVTARERLRREALALSRVRHPGVASIVDMELDDALAFIVTELIDGDTLREDVSHNGAYTGEDLELLTEKLNSAVEAVHAAGIIHRDIKPTNVMISATGPVLVDFGIAMGEGESHVTRTGLVMGTPGFIAPEVIEGSESDEATDWWSVASVLAFAATGKPVFGTKPIMAVLEREASGNADLRGLPQRTIAAFTAALNPHRDQRISHEQLLNAVRQDALDASSGLGGILGGGLENVPTSHNTDSNSGSDTSTEAMRPFEREPRGGRSPGPRSQWTHEVQPATILADAAPTETINAVANLPTQKLLSGDTTQILEAATIPLRSAEAAALKGTTRAMPQRAPAAKNEENSGPATQILGKNPLPTNPVLQNPASVFSAAPPSDTDNDKKPVDSSPPPVLVPAEAEVDQQVRSRFGSSRVLPLILTVPMAFMCAWLPVGGAFIGLVLLWLATARGYSIHAQLLRENKRGGGKKKLDGAVSVMSAPWHVLHGFLVTLPQALQWAVFYVLINLLIVSLSDGATVTSGISLFDRSFTFSLIAGSPRGTGGIALGLTAALAWVISSLRTKKAPVTTGFASAWKTLRAGIAKARVPQSSSVDEGASNEISDNAKNGEVTSISEGGTAVAERIPLTPKRSILGIVFLVLLLAFIGTSIAFFFITTSVDWSPLLLWE